MISLISNRYKTLWYQITKKDYKLTAYGLININISLNNNYENIFSAQFKINTSTSSNSLEISSNQRLV